MENSQAHSNSGPRILLVDRDAAHGRRALQHLSAAGFDAALTDGAADDALSRARSFRPWVFVVNHAPPQNDGVASCRQLKLDSETGHIPVVLTSPLAENEATIVEGLEAGASAIVSGDASPQVLVAHIYVQLNAFQLVMEMREKNRYLRDMATRDQMTKLYNHGYLQEVLEHELHRSRRSGHPVSLLLVDLDHFKGINDGHGHQAGDQCLRAVANILSAGGRKSDVTARYGGDEFAIVLPDTPKPGAAVRGEALRAQVTQLCLDEYRLPPPSVSVGAATFPDDAADRPCLIEMADRALYAAKHMGRNRVVACSPQLARIGEWPGETGPGVDHYLAVEQTIDDRAVKFVYQPIVSSVDGGIYGYEALCRPKHPAFAHPGELFTAAEQVGRVRELGRACRQVSVAPLAELPEPQLMFLNLHPLELCNQFLVEAREHLLPFARRLVLEITESAAIGDFEHRRGLIGELQEEGFLVAVDDLGAGYAGLNSLALLGPDIVKLDMALVRGIESDNRQSRLIRHILDYCSDEGILVVAEGVETERERSVVAELGCPLMQGYLFAKPGPPFVQVNLGTS